MFAVRVSGAVCVTVCITTSQLTNIDRFLALSFMAMNSHAVYFWIICCCIILFNSLPGYVFNWLLSIATLNSYSLYILV